MNIKYIVRKRQLGDVLWIEPIIDEIALKYKKVIVHTKYNEIFNNYKHKNVIFKKELNIFEKILHALENFFNTSILFISLENTYEKDSKKQSAKKMMMWAVALLITSLAAKMVDFSSVALILFLLGVIFLSVSGLRLLTCK